VSPRIFTDRLVGVSRSLARLLSRSLARSLAAWTRGDSVQRTIGDTAVPSELPRLANTLKQPTICSPPKPPRPSRTGLLVCPRESSRTGLLVCPDLLLACCPDLLLDLLLRGLAGTACRERSGTQPSHPNYPDFSITSNNPRSAVRLPPQTFTNRLVGVSQSLARLLPRSLAPSLAA
jgi:hypothetical protein